MYVDDAIFIFNKLFFVVIMWKLPKIASLIL